MRTCEARVPLPPGARSRRSMGIPLVAIVLEKRDAVADARLAPGYMRVFASVSDELSRRVALGGAVY